MASIPPDLPKLPIGSFGVPLGNPTKSSSSCLTQADQGSAWGCAARSYLGLTVIPADYGPPQINLTTGLSPDAPLRYGPQPPQLNSLSSVSIMSDTDEPNRGPAYYFQQNYTKIVILQGDQLSASPLKRGLGEDDASVRVKKRQVAYRHRFKRILPGDQPWICFWNNTMLEGFIYITNNTTIEFPNASAIVSSLLESAAPSIGYLSNLDADPSSTLSPTETGIPNPSAPLPTDAYRPGYSPPTPTSGYAKRGVSQPTSYPSPYPKIIKIEERRFFQNSVNPYCQRMQVLDDGLLGQVPNATGGAIIVQLTEEEPAIAYTGSSSGSRRRRSWSQGSDAGEKTRRDNNACRCEWLSF